MKTATPARVDAVDSEISSILHAFESIFGELRMESKRSRDLYDIGVDTQLTTMIKGVAKDPLKHQLNAYKSLEDSILATLDGLTTEFFRLNSEKLIKVARISENRLHYAIVLKHPDEIDDEMIFIDFKLNYDANAFSERFPLILHFVTEDILQGAIYKQEIPLVEKGQR